MRATVPGRRPKDVRSGGLGTFRLSPAATLAPHLHQYRDQIMEDPQYYQLRNHALNFLYNRFAHDEGV
ncbi:MAG TPA: hypothetical protein VEZ50_08060 [Nodosilinea sp.]|nr:hypothetical protein [Nodosilinea sp.]